MRKLIFAAILAISLMFTLSACGRSSAPAQQSSEPNETTPSESVPGQDIPSSDAAEDISPEALSNADVLASINITHLDDFKQYGFTYEELSAGYEVENRQYVGVLVSDAVKIYVQNGIFAYEISLEDGNLRDVHISETHSPDMEGGNRTLDVGYGLQLSKAQMSYMGFVAKCFYDNPAAPFAHLVPKEIADAAAQNDIFIDVKNANDTWRLLFVSLKYSYVDQVYSDGSQSVIPNAIGINCYADNKSQPISFLANGVRNDSAAYTTARQGLQSIREPGSAFNSETLEWSFAPEIASALVELMQELNMPYEK